MKQFWAVLLLWGFIPLGDLYTTHAQDVMTSLQPSHDKKPFPTLREPQTWHTIIAEAITPYFTARYQDTHFFVPQETADLLRDSGYPETEIASLLKQMLEDDTKYKIQKYIDGKLYIVFRPNHGLAHGMRQSYLAGDLLNAFASTARTQHFFSSSQGSNYAAWVINKINQDPYFLQKVELLAAFQRTGRQSEINESQFPQVYQNYRKSDAHNFKNFANKWVGSDQLFQSFDEVNAFARTLSEDPPEGQNDHYYLTKTLWAVHLLDLKRVLGYNGYRIKKNVHRVLFGEGEGQGERQFVDALWQRSSQYLQSTGETDVDHEKDPQRQTYQDIFYIIANNPAKLVDVLENVKRVPVVLIPSSPKS